ncbi:MAG: AraC family transcriptional regulator [Acidobacteriota bacterium]
MLPSPEDLRRAAAEESIEQIRRDAAQAPERIRALLFYIEQHLFDRELNVNRLKEACRVRDNSIAIHFHAAVGKPPHSYISHRRLETGARLLHASDLPVWRISELLGFSSIQVFSRAFFRWAGLRPTVFRRTARDQGVEMLVPQVAVDGESYWRRAMNGELDVDEAADLIRRLIELYLPKPR